MNKKIEAAILAIMCFVLVIAICIQIKTVNNNGSTITNNQEESNLKSQVLKMKEKYEYQYAELENIEKELEKVRQLATSNNEELKELEKKIEETNVLLGNTNVSGPGVIITLSDGKNDIGLLDPEGLIVHSQNVIAVVSELKNAGAEAISINNQRIVTTTAISCDGNVLVVNGEKINSPIQISAIGLPELLVALNRPGGTLENFVKEGKEIEFKKSLNINIAKYTGVFNFKYANIAK